MAEASEHLNHLIETVLRGKEAEIAINNHPKFGSAKGLVWISDDFNEPLEESKEYMERDNGWILILSYGL